MVIIPDRLTSLIMKGEITERYYNPGNLFREVHLVMTNDDSPERDQLQATVGDARLVLHQLPADLRLFAATLGWRPWLLGPWVRKAIQLAGEVRPQMIRCHGARLNAFAAAHINASLGIPYVVSMHINPDEDVRGRARSWLRKRAANLQQDVERIGLLNAALVMPVYRPIVPYLQRLGVRRYEVCYNALNPRFLRQKTNYTLHRPVRLICVGRQFREKNPENILRALARLPDAHLTLVGNGEYHEYLKRFAAVIGVSERVTFIPSMPNNQLCPLLAEADVFVTHSEYWEIAKAVLEPLLTGLPVIINRRRGEPVPELTEDICRLVDNTEDGYWEALRHMLDDHAAREALGRRAWAHAQEHWAPARTEAKFVEVYKRIMNQSRSAVSKVPECAPEQA